VEKRACQSPFDLQVHPKLSKGETPYNLTYDAKAMLPVEVEEPIIQCELDNLKRNDEFLKTELDLL